MRGDATPAHETLTDLLSCRYVADVYDWCMGRTRTNIEINDSYVHVIMERFGVRTKTDAVDLALRHLAGQPMSRDEALAMRGRHAIDTIPADVGPDTAA